MRSLHTIYRLFTAPLKPIIFYYVILVKTHIFPSYTWPSRSVLARLHMLFTTCKGIQDRLGFWIPRRGFQIPGTGFQSLVLELGFQSFVGLRVPWVVFRIPWAVFCIPNQGDSDSTNKNFPHSGIWITLYMGRCYMKSTLYQFILPVIREIRQIANVK